MKIFFSKPFQLLLHAALLFYSSTLFSGVAKFQSEDERLFKAALIYNFAKFTTWPDSALKQPDYLKLCTYGKSQLISDLEKLNGKLVKGRKVSIINIKKITSIDQCHILYIADNESRIYKKILKKVGKKPILTISGINKFATNKGVIQFYREKGRTRLIINLDVAHHAELEISSRLLILAKVINTQTAP